MTQVHHTAHTLFEPREVQLLRAAGWSETYSEGWPAGFYNHLTDQLSSADSWAELIEQEGLDKPGSGEK